MTMEQNGNVPTPNGPAFIPDVEEFDLDDPNDPITSENSLIFGEELALPESLVEDIEEGDETESAEELVDEVEESADPPDEPAEAVEDSDLSEEEEPEPAEEPEPQDTTEVDEPKPGTPDKYVQQLQQKQATTDRKLDQMMEAMQEMMSTMKGGQDTATDTNVDEDQGVSDDRESTPEQSSSYEEAKAELDRLIAEQQEDEFGEPTSADLARIVAAQNKMIESLRQAPQEGSNADLQEMKQFYQEEVQRQKLNRAWQDFETQNGFDGRVIWQEAVADAQKLIPDDQHASDVLAQKYFQQRVEEQRNSVDEPSQSVPKGQTSKVKPASSKTRKSSKGTQTAPTGAKGAGQKKSGERELRCWRPD